MLFFRCGFRLKKVYLNGSGVLFGLFGWLIGSIVGMLIRVLVVGLYVCRLGLMVSGVLKIWLVLLWLYSMLVKVLMLLLKW